MKRASINDIYEVRQMGLVSDVERESLFELYQPLIGVSSVGLFISLLNDPSKENNVTSSFEELSIRTSLALGELYSAFEALEAVGLVKTYFKGDDKIAYFVFALYSPMDPKEFLNDVLFVGTLTKQIGKKAVQRLIDKYKKTNPVEGFDEVSTSFTEYFSPDFASEVFNIQNNSSLKGDEKAKIKLDFDFIKMVRSLSDLGIKDSHFSEKEREFVGKIASLYSMSESQMGSLISLCFDNFKPLGQRLDLIKLETECRKTFGSSFRREKPVKATKSEIGQANSRNAELIKIMEELTPAQYLAIKQNNTKPAASDLRIVEDLALDLGLPFPVINALVDYVLLTNNNILNKSYIEKIGAALSRSDIKTALDAMDYLYKVNQSFKGKSKGMVSKPKETKIEEEKDEKEEYSDEEIDDLLSSLGDK